jgi:hypothetical protein
MRENDVTSDLVSVIEKENYFLLTELLQNCMGELEVMGSKRLFLPQQHTISCMCSSLA